MTSALPQIGKYRISRRGRKLQISDDSRTLIALPKDVPERTWAEIFQKEENDLVVFDIREDILEEALKVGYENYMERQNAPFTACCTAQAWLDLIDWQFYRHDPGEEPSAYPPCFIPNRVESWIPDELPTPSPKDSWCRQDLNVVEDASDVGVKASPSATSMEFPVVEPIPQEYWFPGKVKLYTDSEIERAAKEERLESSSVHRCALVELSTISGVWHYVQGAPSSNLAVESELLQKVTDYSTEELSKKESTYSALKTTTPVAGSLHGAGDSKLAVRSVKKRPEKSRTFSRASVAGKSRGALLPPLESRSRVSVISDCRLRNLRLETQYEISSEKMDTPQGELVKRK